MWPSENSVFMRYHKGATTIVLRIEKNPRLNSRNFELDRSSVESETNIVRRSEHNLSRETFGKPRSLRYKTFALYDSSLSGGRNVDVLRG